MQVQIIVFLSSLLRLTWTAQSDVLFDFKLIMSLFESLFIEKRDGLNGFEYLDSFFYSAFTTLFSEIDLSDDKEERRSETCYFYLSKVAIT